MCAAMPDEVGSPTYVVKTSPQDLVPVSLSVQPMDEAQALYDIMLCSCGSLVYEPITLLCGHTFCRSCKESMQYCALCSARIHRSYSYNVLLASLVRKWFPSYCECAQLRSEGHTLLQQGRYDEAIRLLTKALEKTVDVMSLVYRSEALAMIKKGREALQDAIRANQLKPCCRVVLTMARALDVFGRTDLAIRAVQLCLDLKPDKAMQEKALSYMSELLSRPPLPVQRELNPVPAYPDLPGQSLITSSEELWFNRSLGSDRPGGLPRNSSFESSEPPIKRHRVPPSLDHAVGCPTTSVTLSSVASEITVSRKFVDPTDLECHLCLEIFVQPTTAPCGHILCRSCLDRCVDHDRPCPVCRASLDDFRSTDVRHDTHMLDLITRTALPHLYKDRVESINNRMLRLSRCGIDESIELPIFVCTTCFPSMRLSLRVFEPRYRVMVRESLQSGSRRFGMCIKDNEVGFVDVGTVLEIQNSQRTPDGRLLISTLGRQRFVVSSRSQRDGFHTAMVKYFQDTWTVMGEEEHKVLLARCQLVYSMIGRYVRSLSQDEQRVICNTLGFLPGFEKHPESFPDGVPWLWWAIAALPFKEEQRIAMLRLDSFEQRLDSLHKYLRLVMRCVDRRTNCNPAPPPQSSAVGHDVPPPIHRIHPTEISSAPGSEFGSGEAVHTPSSQLVASSSVRNVEERHQGQDVAPSTTQLPPTSNLTVDAATLDPTDGPSSSASN